MVASFRESKNSRRMRPFSPIFPMTRPNVTQNTIIPSTLIPSEYVPTSLYSLVIFYQEKKQGGDSLGELRLSQEAAFTTTLADSKESLRSCANGFSLQDHSTIKVVTARTPTSTTAMTVVVKGGIAVVLVETFGGSTSLRVVLY